MPRMHEKVVAAKKPVKVTTPEQKITKAKRVATQAINASAAVHTDLGRNRSTRTREAYKIKSEALDRVARILTGKE